MDNQAFFGYYRVFLQDKIEDNQLHPPSNV